MSKMSQLVQENQERLRDCCVEFPLTFEEAEFLRSIFVVFAKSSRETSVLLLRLQDAVDDGRRMQALPDIDDE